MPGIDISPDARALLLALFQPYLPGVTVWAFGSRVKGAIPAGQPGRGGADGPATGRSAGRCVGLTAA